MKNDVGTLAFSQAYVKGPEAESRVTLCAMAAIEQDFSLCDELHISQGYMRQFMNYAYCYYNKSVDFDKKFQQINSAVAKEIRKQIDNGAKIGNKIDYTPRAYKKRNYPKHVTRSIEHRGPAIATNPIKEEGPAVVQQKLPLQNPSCSEKPGPVSRNDVDKKALMKEALATFKETFKELCQTIRAL